MGRKVCSGRIAEQSGGGGLVTQSRAERGRGGRGRGALLCPPCPSVGWRSTLIVGRRAGGGGRPVSALRIGTERRKLLLRELKLPSLNA